MIHFENHQYFYLMAVLPLLLLWWIFSRQQQQRKFDAIGDRHLMRKLLPAPSLYLLFIKWIVLLFVFSALLLVLCKPYIYNNATTTNNAAATDVVFVVDVSQSMYVKDVAPDRISQTRNLLQSAIKNFTEEQVGVVLFAGKAGAYVPLTNDYEYINNSIASIGGDLMEQGTSLRESLKIAQLLFDPKSGRNRFIVLLSDGEFHDAPSLALSDSIRESGISLMALGLGTPNGGEVPLNRTGNSSLVKRNTNGKAIHSYLHEKEMKRIVGNQNQYHRATDNATSIAWLFQQIHEKESTQVVRSRKFVFNVFLIVALCFLVLETMIPSTTKENNEQ
jgi:Ca-activated chloride channel family protein